MERVTTIEQLTDDWGWKTLRIVIGSLFYHMAILLRGIDGQLDISEISEWM